MDFDWLFAIKAGITATLMTLSAVWGWLGWLIIVWVCAMALDYCTGTLAAMRKGKWRSKVARDGLFRKAGEILIVLVGAFGDGVLATIVFHIPAVEFHYPVTGLLLPLVVVWYTITEMGSIVENAEKLGATIPAWLQKILQLSKSAVDNAGESLTCGHQNETDL